MDPSCPMSRPLEERAGLGVPPPGRAPGLATNGSPGVGVSRCVAAGIALAAVAVALAVLGTWPLAAHLSTHIFDAAQSHGPLKWTVEPDQHLNGWILAWDVHALRTAPWSLFDANIFHPAPRTLAASEHMLGALPLYLPLSIASGDPVFASQAMLVLTFACCWLAMFALVRDWTGSIPAAALAASWFAFAPVRYLNLPHVQIEGSYYLPLLPLLAHRAVVRPGRRWAAAFAAALALQALHSFYLAYAAFIGTATLCAVVVSCDQVARSRWKTLLVAGLAAASIVAVVSVPYLAGSREEMLHGPSVSDLPSWAREPGALEEMLASSPFSILVAGSPADFVPRSALLPAALALVLLRRGPLRAISPVWIAGLAVSGLVLHLLALGPFVRIGGRIVPGPYTLATRLLPGFHLVRAPYRLDLFTSMATSALAGIGVANLVALAGAPGSRLRRFAALAAIVLAALVPARATDGPLQIQPIETRETVPPAYRWLADAPPGAVVELPFADYEFFLFERGREALRVHRSIFHWHPIVNGYSGYAPRTHRLMAAIAARLPDADAVADLVRLAGVRYALVDESITPDADRWRGSGLEAHRFGTTVVYVLPGPLPEAPPLARPVETWEGRTPDGASLAPLSHADQAFGLDEALFPKEVLPGFAFIGSIVVENRGGTRWPGIVPLGHGGVVLEAAVVDPDGGVPAATFHSTPLGIDLGPGARARTPVWLGAPLRPGAYRIDVRLAQDGVGPFDPGAGRVVSVPLTVVSP